MIRASDGTYSVIKTTFISLLSLLLVIYATFFAPNVGMFKLDQITAGDVNWIGIILDFSAWASLINSDTLQLEHTKSLNLPDKLQEVYNDQWEWKIL